MRDLPLPDPYLVEDAQRFLEDQQRSRIAGLEVQLAVAACGTGMLWGGVSLYAVDLTQRRASIGAQRCGFRREGVLRSHMTFKAGRRDTVVHSLLAGDLTE